MAKAKREVLKTKNVRVSTKVELVKEGSFFNVYTFVKVSPKNKHLSWLRFVQWVLINERIA